MTLRLDRRGVAALAVASLPLTARAQAVPVLNLMIARRGAAAGVTALDEALCQALGDVRRGRVALSVEAAAVRDTARAAPDGTTLLLTDDVGTFIRPTTRPIVPDQMPRLAPVTMAFRFPRVLGAKPEFGVTDLPALLARAAAQPEGVAIQVGPGLSSDAVAVALLEQTAGVRFTMAGPGVRSPFVPRPRWDLAFDSPAYVSRSLRPVAVVAPRRIAALPAVPTFAELGHPGFDALGWWGIFAPPDIPAETVQRLHRDITRACAMPRVRDSARAIGGETALLPPAEFAALVTGEGPRIIALASRLQARLSG